MFKKRKYNNATCKCRGGHIHDSRQEASYCDKLSLLKKAGEIKDYETQVTFHLHANGMPITKHRVDFLITNNDGTEEVHEWKGMRTDVWRIKHKLFEANHPEIRYIVKQGRDCEV